MMKGGYLKIKNTPFARGATLVLSTLSLFSGLWFAITNSQFLSRAGDFINYFVGASIVADGRGRELYDTSVLFSYQEIFTGKGVTDLIMAFRSPSFVALLYFPLTFFSIGTAYVIFAIINSLTLGIFTLFLMKTFSSIKRNKHLLTAVFLFLPVLQTLWGGQLSILLTLIFLLTFISMKSKNFFTAGLFSSLIFTRPQYLILIPFLFLLADDKKRFLSGFLSASLFLVILSVNISGWHSLVNYPSYLMKTENPNFGSRSAGMLTFHSTIVNLPLSSISTGVLSLGINAIAYFVTFLLFARRCKNVGFDKSFVSAVLFSIVFSIHSLPYDLTLLLVPIFIFFDSALSKSGVKKNPDLVFGVLLFLLPLPRYLFRSYYLSFIMLFVGFYYLHSEEYWKNLARSFVTRIKKRT